MTQEQWKLTWSVYREAADLRGADLAAFLSSQNLPAEVAAEVRELLVSREAEATADPGDMEWRFGPFRLIDELGQGAMGTVYRAEQERPLRRTVAIKVVRPGLRSQEVLERFEIERRVLAMMDHPGIARVYDAGETPNGRPYFAMEYVPGLPITEFCARHSLSTRQRLGLIVEICDALQHAHQKGIIHRDIKPSNVLVCYADGRPSVKVIDFGVARALRSAEAETLATMFGSVVGTLAYMSPEQSACDSSVADTRSDIYSIGALAYELVTGSAPLVFEKTASTLGVAGLAAALERIQSEEPAAPSRVAKAAGRDAKPLAREVDWILLKALDKDPARRYQSANALARDLQRHFHGEAVEAGPPSTLYKIGKLARSYRSLLATVAAFVLVLALATVVSVRQAIRATAAEHAALIERDRALAAQREVAAGRDRALSAERNAQRERDVALAERHRADGEAAAAQAIDNFLRNDLLGQAAGVAQANRGNTPTRDLKVRDALDRAAASVAGRFPAQPAVEAAIRFTIGLTYHDLGIYPQARAQLERCLELRRQVLPRDHPETLEAIHMLAAVARGEGRFADAERLYRDVYERRGRVLGRDHPDTLRSLHGVAITLRSLDKTAEAIAIHQQVLETRLRSLGEGHPDTMRSLNDLAIAHIYTQGGEKKGLDFAERAYRLRLEKLGAAHPETLTSHHAYALALYNDSQNSPAAAEFARVIPHMEAVHGRDYNETINALGNYALTLAALHRFSDATRLEAEALERRRRVSGASHFETLKKHGDVGLALFNEGRIEEACGELRLAWEGLAARWGAAHAEAQRMNFNLVMCLTSAGQYAEAVQRGEEGLQVRRRVRGPGHQLTELITLQLAEAYGKAGRHEDAGAILRRAIQEHREAEGPAVKLQKALAVALVRQGRFAEAEPLAREGVAGHGAADDSWNAWMARSILGAALAGQNKFAEAAPLLQESLAGLDRQRDAAAVNERPRMEEVRGWVRLLR